MKRQLNALVMRQEWEDFKDFLNLLLQKGRDKLEQEDCEEIRGDCKRLRKLLRLEHDLKN